MSPGWTYADWDRHRAKMEPVEPRNVSLSRLAAGTTPRTVSRWSIKHE